MEKYEQGGLQEDRTISRSEIVRFGERLREAMKGMSNVELAKRSGLSEGSIRKYIKGESYPSIDNAALVADACGVSLIWLLCGSNEVREINHNSTSDEEGDFRDLLTIFKSLSIAERRSLLHLLGRKGSELLAQLLNDDNLCLMKLSGEKREAALLLVEMDPERAREILSKMREHSGLAQPENHQVKHKRAGAA
ncbi:helix-turn-helix domain-containing protein [Serratia marcescens]|uniref:helix-turn-helix domain-containing protein n=1 Tax=Serratia marcescens TaxID=615 RepID=UPI0013FF00AD|nr:helix-turn-helix domain-containing protein [Salmonella enterica]ELG8585659.1 helix-turn-helix domain-containing protein [Salmonella enterica]